MRSGLVTAAARWVPALALVGCIAGAGCDHVDLERMIDQKKFTTYSSCDLFPNGTIMQDPPIGTIPRNKLIAPDAVTRGLDASGWTRTIPIEVDREMVERGRGRFDIFCAACHGRLGNGVSQVAENMKLRQPPSLIDPPYLSYPPGRIYAVITEGFGLMRSYSAQLTVGDRWAVVAYLEALQLSQRSRLDQLPPDARREASKWLK